MANTLLNLPTGLLSVILGKKSIKTNDKKSLKKGFDIGINSDIVNNINSERINDRKDLEFANAENLLINTPKRLWTQEDKLLVDDNFKSEFDRVSKYPLDIQESKLAFPNKLKKGWNFDLYDKETPNESTVVVDNNTNKTVVNPVQKSLIDEMDDSRKRESTLGMLGYGLQGLSALRDLNQNANQEYTEPPKPIILSKVEYKPTDAKPYMDKIEQASAGYLKYLKETGNGSLIPSLMGMETQKNDLAAKITETNNQKEVAIRNANSQTDMQTQELNSRLRSDYNRQKFSEMQYKDQAMNTNKQAIFGAISGLLKTYAGNSSQYLKLKAMKEYLETADDKSAWNMLSNMFNTGSIDFGDNNRYRDVLLELLNGKTE